MQANKQPGMQRANRRLVAATARNVLFVMIGVGGLVLKGAYSGPGEELVHSYGGNVAASFAVYFWARLATREFAARSLANRTRREQQPRLNLSRTLAAGLALAIVQLFELLDGFGVMTNVYDRFDLLANAVGVAIGFALDASIAVGDWRPAEDEAGVTGR
jgi:hypothetical protein